MATTPQFLDALASHTYPLQGPLSSRNAVVPLLHLLRQALPGAGASVPTKGLIIHTPATTIEAIVIHSVSTELLGFLDYADEAAYAAAVVAGGFVHPDDVEVTTAHLQGSSETYDARLRRAGGTYRRMRLQGVTLDLSDIAATVTASGALRLTLIWPVP